MLRDGDVVYPAPWARDASTSFLLRKDDTRTTLEEAGFKAVVWCDDTQIALDWFKSVMAGSPPTVLNLGLVIGPDFPAITGNLITHGLAFRILLQHQSEYAILESTQHRAPRPSQGLLFRHCTGRAVRYPPATIT